MYKRTALLACLFLLTILTWAQPYRVIDPERDYLFSRENLVRGFTNTDLVVHLDSSVTNGADTLRYNYRIARIDTMQEYDTCYFSMGDTSWLGWYFVERPGNQFIFFNRAMDSIFIQPDAPVFQLFRYPNGNRIVATRTSTVWDTVPGGMDSIRIFRLQATDAGGNPDSNHWNGFDLKISRELGLRTGFSFFHFPDTVTGMSREAELAGMTGPDTGIRTVLLPEIWDILPGDTIQTYYLKRNTQEEHEVRYQYVYLSRWMNIAMDSVYWEVERSYKGFMTDWLNSRNYQGRDTTIFSAPLTGETSFNLPPYASNGPNAQLASPFQYPGQYYGSDYRGRQIRYTHLASLADTLSGCYHDIPLWGPQEHFAIEGLGGGYYFEETGAIDKWVKQPTWYHKSGETWGTKIDFSGVTSVRDGVREEVSLNIFPHPSDGRFNVDVSRYIPGATLRVLEITGRVVATRALSTAGEAAFTPEDFPGAGVYLLELRNTDGVLAVEKVVVF